MRNFSSPWINGSTLIGLLTIATGVAVGCDGGETNTTGTGGTTTTSEGGNGGTTTTDPTGGGGEGGTTTTEGGGGTTTTSTTTSSTTTSTTTTNPTCTETAPGASRGSAIALAKDDTVLVAVNRDVGTVTVMSVSFADGDPAMTKTAELDLGAGSEPWQVAIDGCGDKAYVVTRHDQKVHEILDLKTTPTLGKSVAVGSEPTGIAITPNNTALYVTNWVDGTVMKIDTADMTVASTIDLNKTLTDTGLLGPVVSRASLAHPRALVITNDGDEDDTDERVFVTEWFAQRTEPEAANGSNADTSKKGLLYHFATADETPATYDLPPVADAGFNDHNAAPTGCFPNQVGAVNVSGGFVFVTSTCASPKGPVGVFAGKNAGGACTVLTEAADCGALGGTCNAVTLTCNPNTTDVKTTTHPAVTILNAETGAGSTTLLDAKFDALANAFPKRMPLLPTDIDFINNFAYVTGFGTDAVFRMQVNAGAIGTVGSANNNFINLRRPMNDALIRTPIGLVIAHTQLNAFVANEGSRDVTALELNAQAIAGNQTDDFRIAQSSDLPAAGSPEEAVLKGKRFFNTGLGRWSLRGEGWGSCAACHIDGLTDNVTWYFARGPRQSTSLDGSFSKMDPTDQRIFNWTALFDEVADFEANTRGVSGGVGAIVSVANNPPMVSDRINTGAGNPPQQGLQGSSLATSLDPGALDDWLEITEYMKTIRSPRRPTNLVAADVTAGKALFGNAAQGNCIGCHSGSKWTISKVFWPVGNIANAATNDAAATSLSNISWNTALNGFPAALFPVTTPDATNTRMRFGAPPGAEQIQCILRPVGTFGISPAAVGVAELRQDMTTAAQGNAATGRGFNPPSLLGMQVGAPYFHAGNARTLEEVFDNLFTAHHQSAVAAVFSPTEAQKQQLAAYLLSIDKDEMAFNVPAKGASGGDICFYP
jgi:DNA-binding beta-propeller fold protein YncE